MELAYDRIDGVSFLEGIDFFVMDEYHEEDEEEEEEEEDDRDEEEEDDKLDGKVDILKGFIVSDDDAANTVYISPSEEGVDDESVIFNSFVLP